MKLYSSSIAGVLLICFAQLIAVAPTQNNAALNACVEHALVGKNVKGRIVTPSSDTYAAASAGNVLLAEYPAVIVYATSVDEISPLVKCGTASGYKVTPRSGGHHFENWSALNETLVVDISHINYVKSSNDLSTATVAAGAKLGQIYETLDQTGHTMIGGICPTVGIGGYLGVGGYNMQMRAYGMAVDHVQSIKAVLADGRLVTASATENPDLFWAMRGGGTYGFTVETTVKTFTIPRSAMVWMNFTGPTRNEATQKYLDWASKQDPLFNSQLNLYSDRAGVLGWYVGKTVPELTAIVKASGLMDIPDANIKVSGNCSTENSRNFWQYTQTECTDDATAHELFNTWFNVVPDNFAPVPGAVKQFGFDDIPVLPNQTKAIPWPRISLINKTYFITKSKPLQPETIQYITEKSGALPAELGFWTEMTSFNISTPATSAFAWQEEAEYLFRFEVLRSSNTTLQAIGQKFMDDLDAYLVPRIGSASYAGYVDADISTNPYTSYWGDNVCKLSSVKKRYDPTNLFSNPFSIPPTTPEGVQC
ncbi:hypothetical protein MMC22_009469 [Lobaria immixta]|nr:hypothetical protein [Lobaria immixta]